MRNIYGRKRKKRVFVTYIFLAALLFSVFNYFAKPTSGDLISPLPASNEAQVKKISNEALDKGIEEALSGTKGTYGIVIKNLKTGESYYKNESQVFESGSLYKLWVMAEVFEQIKNGELKMDDELSQSIPALNSKFSISPEFAELTEGSITMSVEKALTQMITISHNYAALLLTEKIKLSRVAKFLTENGFKYSKVGNEADSPKTTPQDIALFFEKLYKGELADPDNTNKMLDFLKQQKLNNKIPKYLPEGLTIAHKTGEIYFLTHDAGIVYTDKGDYIIVVLSESESPKGAEDRIALVSKAAYDYFINN
jgi:beta-lactamase class A